MKVTVCCIADTHGLLAQLPISQVLPHYDVVVDAGDVCRKDPKPTCWEDVICSDDSQHVLLLPGNFDEALFGLGTPPENITLLARPGVAPEIVVEAGVRFYGFPYGPESARNDWSELCDSDLNAAIAAIPNEGVDVLVLHVPPAPAYGRWGFQDNRMLDKIRKMKGLKAVVFGHDHDAKQAGYINDATLLPVSADRDANPFKPATKVEARARLLTFDVQDGKIELDGIEMVSGL